MENKMLKKETGRQLALSLMILACSMFCIVMASAANITSCQTISSPGTYILSNNINSTGTCLTIAADNVVLDCQGKTINYSSSSIGNGIYVYRQNNITIKNCIILQTNNSGVCQNDSVGIYFNCYDRVCLDVNITNNRVWVCGGTTDAHSQGTQGMAFRNILNSKIIDNTITSLDGSGIQLTGNSRNISVRLNYVNAYSRNINTLYAHAIYLHPPVYDSIVENNNVSSNSGAGVYVHAGDNNTVRSNVITNSDSGVGTQAPNTTIFNNTIEAGINPNRGYGIRLYGADTINSNVKYNRVLVKSNGGFGLMIWSGQNINVSDNIITAIGNCSVYGVCVPGIWLRDSANNNTIKNNTVVTPGLNASGIYIQSSSSNNTIIRNNITASQGNGINISSSPYNTITNNTADNGIFGIVITSSINNILANNTASYNQKDGIKLSSSSTLNSFNDNIACYNNQANAAYKDVNDADNASFIKQVCDNSNKLGICLDRCTPLSVCCNATYYTADPSGSDVPIVHYANGWFDLPCDELRNERVITDSLIVESPYDNCTSQADCPVTCPVVAKFTQEIKPSYCCDTTGSWRWHDLPCDNSSSKPIPNSTANCSNVKSPVNWIANYLPATSNDLINQDTPVALKSEDIFENAVDPDAAVDTNKRYSALYPRKGIDIYMESNRPAPPKAPSPPPEEYPEENENDNLAGRVIAKITGFIAKLFGIDAPTKKFNSPYVAVWNASSQSKVYLTAWGMDKDDHATTVGNQNMTPYMPYFASPERAAKVTWVGRVPQHAVMEFKYGPASSDHENYIVLPLDTTIKTAKDLCEAKADDGSDLMSEEDNIAIWNVENQTAYYPTQGVGCYSCGDIKTLAGCDFSLNPGQVYRITFPEGEGENWAQK